MELLCASPRVPVLTPPELMRFAPATTTTKCLIQSIKMHCAAAFQHATEIKIEARAASVNLDMSQAKMRMEILCACPRVAVLTPTKLIRFAPATTMTKCLTIGMAMHCAANFQHAKDIKIEARAASVNLDTSVP